VGRRRNLVNVAGSLLKKLFGVVTVMDLDKLHGSIKKLYDIQSYLHSALCK